MDTESFAISQLRELVAKLAEGSATLCEFQIVIRPIQERERLINPNVKEMRIVYEVQP